MRSCKILLNEIPREALEILVINVLDQKPITTSRR